MFSWLDQAKDIFIKGGPVMWPLLALSVIALALILERAQFWLVQRPAARAQWMKNVAARLRASDAPALHAIAAGERTIYTRVLASILESPPHQGLAVELVEQYRPELERYSSVLSTIITAAPLLGILGTVLGIIESFDLLGKTRDIAEIERVASGIAEALITTAAGLVVTLITLFPYMHLRTRIDRALGDIERLAAAALAGAPRGLPTPTRPSPSRNAAE